MRQAPHVTLSAAARFYTPLIVLFASTLLVVNTPGAGIGVVAGFAFALALVLHVLVFGSDAARIAAPPGAMRVLAALGLVVAFIGAAAPGLPLASQLSDAGSFLVTTTASALILTVIVGRAPTMRDEQ